MQPFVLARLQDGDIQGDVLYSRQAMHMDPAMPALVGSAALILVVGVVLVWLKQPHVVAYLVAGVLLGPYGLGVIESPKLVARLGEIGVVLLLFFVGSEISLPKLTANWRVPVVGTALQVLASVACTYGIGTWKHWPMGRSILLGFVISLSSTAVVVKILNVWNESESQTGRDVIGVLLVQDVCVVVMLIIIGLLGGERPDALLISKQCVGGLALVSLLFYLGRRESIRLPFGDLLRRDKELQVFSAFFLCLVFALLTGFLGLSAALGAFVAGIVIAAAQETEWVHNSLYPFQVLLVALFFVSVGMALDLVFIKRNVITLSLLLVAVMLTNNLVNAVAFRFLGRSWRESLYGGALLAQIGEFSFVLAAVGQQHGLIETFAYQATVAVIALSLAISPLWIGLFRRYATRNEATPDADVH